MNPDAPRRRDAQGEKELFPELEIGLPDGEALVRSSAPDCGSRQPSSPVPPRSPDDWIRRIREQEMPALGATVALVQSITEDENASTAGLAQVILQDASMTAKVLKLANSAYYNRTRQPVSTVSRAIVLLGFDVVAEMAIGIQLVDALLSGGGRRRVVDEMACCFHAAVLARLIANLRSDTRAEEVFIAGLLSRVGEMAFWTFGGEAAERLDVMLAAPGVDPERMQLVVPGFRLRQLSVGLAREWKLGPLVSASLEPNPRPSPTERTILMGRRLADETRQGWERPAVEALITELARFVGEEVDTLTEALADATEEAARIAVYFGAGEAALKIPLQRPSDRDAPALPAEEVIEADPMLQLRILRELSGMIGGGAPLNEIMHLVLEGILRGVGFDRVLFALLTPNRQQLVGKAGLGVGIEGLRQHYVFSLAQDDPDDLFSGFFRDPSALRIIDGKAPRGLRAERLQMVSDAKIVCLAPIVIRGQVIGLFHAERRGGQRELSDDDFEAFQLFVQQISLAGAAVAAGTTRSR